MRKMLLLACFSGFALGCSSSDSKPGAPTADEVKLNEERLKKAAKGEGG